MANVNPNQLPIATDLQGTDKVIIQQETTNAGTLDDLKDFIAPIATDSNTGVVKAGSNVTIGSDGSLSAPTPTPEYTLPIASDSGLGGIKVGDNLSIEEDGTLNATSTISYTLPIATNLILGGVKTGKNVTIDPTTGLISVPDSALVYNVKDFGAKGDGVTDDTVSIQNCINAVFEFGGGVVYFPIGIYIIGGAVDASNNQISFPFQPYADGSGNQTQLMRIKLLGEVGPVMFSDPINGGAPPNSGAILKSTILGGGNVLGAIITGGWNFLHPEIENITIRVRSKTTGTNVAPELTGLNFKSSAFLTMANVAVDTETNRNETLRPADTVTGIIFPQTGNYVFVNADRVLVTGFGTGMELWECASVTNYFIDGCYYGVSFNPTNHAAFLNKGFISRTAIDVVVRGECFFQMENYGFESDPAGWFANISNLTELTPGGQGIIKYNRVISNIGPDNSDFIRSSYGESQITVESIGYSATATNFNEQTIGYDLKPIDRENTIAINTSSLALLRISSDDECHIPSGTSIPVIQEGTGDVAIMAFGVIFNSLSGNNVSKGQYSRILLTKRGVNNWLLSGDLGSVYPYNDSTTNTEVIAFATVAGIVDSFTIAILNEFVTTLKTASIWSLMTAIYPLVGTTAQNQSINLVNSATFPITWHGTGSHDAKGYHPDGTTGYGDTGLIPSSSLSQNSVHMLFYSPDNIGGTTACYIGAFTSSQPVGLFMQPLYTDGNNYSNINSAGVTMPRISYTNGILMIGRESAGTSEFIQNRVIHSQSDTSNGQPSGSIFISALNRDGSPSNFANNTVGFVSIGGGLTDSQKNTYFNALLILLTGLNK